MKLADENCPSILSPYPSSSLPDCCIVEEHDCCIPNLWSVPQWSESSCPGRHKWPRTQHLCLPILCHCISYISHVLYISYMHQASHIVCISNVPPPPCFSSSTGRAHWGCGHAGHASCAGHNGSTWYVGVFMIKFCRLKKWALVHNGVFILQQMRTRHL